MMLDGVRLSDVLERCGSPLHVVDRARLVDNASRFLAKPAHAGRPCEAFFSYKTNPVPGLLRQLHAHGIGAEAASPYELWLAHRLGVPGRSIIYDCPAKPDASIREAIDLGIQLMTLNARPEIGVVAGIARSAGRKARVGLRVGVPQSISGQFGHRIDDGSALAAFAEALKRPELDVVAMHSHLNSEIATAAQLDAYLDVLLGFADVLRDELGLRLEILDLGGNLACSTVSRRSALAQRFAVALGRSPSARRREAVLTIDGYVDQVIRRVEGHYLAARQPTPRIFLEPGRAMTGNAQMLLCRVLQVREPDESGLSIAILDAGINIADGLRSENHQLFALHEPPREARHLYRLTGPTCTLGDLLYPTCELPQLRRGDALSIMDTGAYFVPYSNCFSFPRPAVVMLEGGRERVLRRAETFEHLIALDEIP
jgi:diaminopimelate decarboxylase